jgi:5-methylcytosine-specific restriction endonuclease McrA
VIRRAPIQRRKVCRRARSASAFAGLALAKGRRRKAATAAKRAHRGAWIEWLRALVFSLRPACQLCGAGHGRHEMHECVSRARLRGCPVEVIFNLWNCARLCHGCHRDVTERRADVVMGTLAAGCDGPLLKQPRLPGLVPAPDRLPNPPGAAVDRVLALWRDRPREDRP